ncbi:MAG: hypothetical protein Q6M04_11620 [Thermostichus sp. BF3_bins_97]
MTTKIRLTYRLPSSIEGFTRVLDIPGVFRDEIDVVDAPSIGKYYAKVMTFNKKLLPPEVSGAQAIVKASACIHQKISSSAGTDNSVVSVSPNKTSGVHRSGNSR